MVVPFATDRLVRVEEAATIRPPPPFGVRSLPVEVAHLEFAPLALGQVVRQVSPVKQSVVTAKLVEVALVEVALTIFKFVIVEEAVLTMRAFET